MQFSMLYTNENVNTLNYTYLKLHLFQKQA